MYETFPNVHANSIAEYQDSLTDHLKLSGEKYLIATEQEFEIHQIWKYFIESKSVMPDALHEEVKPRDETSGLWAACQVPYSAAV